MKDKIHDLKTWPEMFEAVGVGVKTTEYRKNDRNFKRGQYLNLRKWYPELQQYSGHSLLVEIKHNVSPGFGMEIVPDPEIREGCYELEYEEFPKERG